MSKALFAQRRDCRVASLQFIYAWGLNPPANLLEDMRVFFEQCEHPREHYSFAEELIHGVIQNVNEIDSHIKGLAHNWEFERIAKIDLAILRRRTACLADARSTPLRWMNWRRHSTPRTLAWRRPKRF